MGNKENTKAWKILEFIGSKGREGAGLTEIQHYIWTVLDGYSEESFWKKRKCWGWDEKNQTSRDIMLRGTRGHWCTALYGGPSYHTGLLHEYCVPSKRKWILASMPKPDERIFKYKDGNYKGHKSYWNG